MKLTVNSMLNRNLSPVIVYLDGVKVDSCISFDTDKGTVERYRKDNDGNPVIIGDEFDTEVLNGVVTYEWVDEVLVSKGLTKPKTFGCNHSHITHCPLCKGRVVQWRHDNRELI